MYTVFVCLDDNNGMLFHKRRQSMDAKVREDMLRSIPPNKKLLVTAYTARQFSVETAEFLDISEDLLPAEDEDIYFFNEATQLAPMQKEIHTLVIYRWNRKYPADVYFDLDLSEWEEKENTEITGSSHERISKLTYCRRTNQ